MAITIKGEVGKAFNQVERDIATVATGARLSFDSLAQDQLTFGISPKFLTAAGESIPEEGQEMTLYIDGARQFVGHVSTVSSNWTDSDLEVSVVVSGPWFFLENTALSDLIEVDKERPQFRCPIGDLRPHITRLLDRAITLGVPMSVGTISTLYDVPTITLRDGSLAHGLSELIRQVPDAIGWFDYSGIGLPEFSLTRRGDLASNLTLGVTNIESVDLEAQFNLVVKKVSVPYAARSPEGVTTLLTQESTEGVTGGLQIVALSGPELLDYEPPEIDLSASGEGENYTVTSKQILFDGFYNRDSRFTRLRMIDFAKFWPFHRTWKGRYTGMQTLPFSAWHQARNEEFPWTNKTFDGLTLVLTDDDGNIITSTSQKKYAVVENGNPLPSWLWDSLGAMRVRVTGNFFVFVEGSFVEFPDWVDALRAEGIPEGTFTQVGGDDDDNNDQWINFDADFDIILIDQELDGVTFNRDALEITGGISGYEYEVPPAGYAQSLRDAQSWLPHTGTVSILSEDVAPITRYSGRTLNISGGLPKWTAMGALIQGEEFDLATGEHTLRAGLPPRFSGATQGTRIDRRANNNIVTL